MKDEYPTCQCGKHGNIMFITVENQLRAERYMCVECFKKNVPEFNEFLSPN
jgi:predicted SprT family Zn-dependent metalloprotease